MFKKNNSKMYYFNAYNDVIDDFIATYNVMEMELSSMLLEKDRASAGNISI